MIFKRWLSILAVMGLVFLFTSTANPAPQSEIESLRGLEGVYVFVEELNKETKRELPFDENQIRADAELKLRTAGIKVLTRNEFFNTSGSYLYLQLTVGSLPMLSGFYYNINVNLRQQVILKRSSRSLYGTTWDTNYAGFVSRSVASSIRDAIKARVDEFVNDYLSVNPNGVN
jgi:hypothetical protein